MKQSEITLRDIRLSRQGDDSVVHRDLTADIYINDGGIQINILVEGMTQKIIHIKASPEAKELNMDVTDHPEPENQVYHDANVPVRVSLVGAI